MRSRNGFILLFLLMIFQPGLRGDADNGRKTDRFVEKPYEAGETWQDTRDRPGGPPSNDAQEESVPPKEAVFVIDDPDEFSLIVPTGAEVVLLATGMQFVEGPVWIPDRDCLLFSDIPANVIRKWQKKTLSVYRKPSRHANGNLLDEKGRLVTCEHGSRTVTRTSKDGRVETLIAGHDGRKFNSPNDLAIRSDGTIWFSDPPYGLKKRTREMDSNNVFCFHPETGKTEIAASDFDRPNGLCLSPDEKRLYIADSGRPRHIRVFEVKPDGSLARGKVFCKIDKGAPDGIRCDEKGRVFSSAADGVHLFAPDGKRIGKILVPESAANLCFGGTKGKKLFITARTSLYAIELKVGGSFPGAGK